MKTKRKLIESILLFAITLILLVTSTVAWFSLDVDSQLNEVVLPVGKQDVAYLLEISRNENDFTTIDTTEQMLMFFSNAVPGDTFDFKLHLENRSSSSVKTAIMLGPVLSENVHEDFDMRDVFVLDKGRVSFQGVESTFPLLEEDPVVVKHGQELSRYRIGRLIGGNSSILLAQGMIEKDESVVLAFRLTYDEATSRNEYQAGSLQLNRFTIYFNN